MLEYETIVEPISGSQSCYLYANFDNNEINFFKDKIIKQICGCFVLTSQNFLFFFIFLIFTIFIIFYLILLIFIIFYFISLNVGDGKMFKINDNKDESQQVKLVSENVEKIIYYYNSNSKPELFFSG
jgi:ATP-dependent Zn protease